MMPKIRLIILWLLYTFFLVWGSGALPGKPLTIVFIIIGTFLGMLLPKAMTIGADLFLVSHSKDQESLVSRFSVVARKDAMSLFPTTKVGQLLYSWPFLFAFGVTALYIVTSTSGWFGKSLVLGMGLALVSDLFVSNRDKLVLKTRWFSAFHAKLSNTELDIFVYGSLAGFILLSILSLVS